MLVLIKGAGDLASGIACRLRRCGMDVVMTDLPHPTTVRWSVAFSPAIYRGTAQVEGLSARQAEDPDQARSILARGEIAVLAADTPLSALAPDALVDAILAKKNLGTRMDDAPVVVGVGPGFTAGADCHAVVETQRGHNLGRVLYQGSPAPNTGVPGDIGGYTVQRLLRAPADGVFQPLAAIGDLVSAGDTVAVVGDAPVTAAISGVVRGLLPQGTPVRAGMKAGDVDPRGIKEYCFTVSDKSNAVAGGVLEAILTCWKGGGVRVRL